MIFTKIYLFEVGFDEFGKFLCLFPRLEIRQQQGAFNKIVTTDVVKSSEELFRCGKCGYEHISGTSLLKQPTHDAKRMGTIAEIRLARIVVYR